MITSKFAYCKYLNDNDLRSAMYICLCNGITEQDIRSCCAEGGASTMRDLENCLGVGAGCGKCRSAAKQVLQDARALKMPRSGRTDFSGAPA